MTWWQRLSLLFLLWQSVTAVGAAMATPVEMPSGWVIWALIFMMSGKNEG